jgi:hypothetical protein
MHRHVIDRWTDTTAFSCAVIVSGLIVLPVLAMGVLITVVVGARMLTEQSGVELQQALFALLSIGGVLGFAGYVRALRGVRRPEGHNLSVTLICLAAGVVTALVVAGFALIPVLATSIGPWNERGWVAAPTLFAVANLVWALSGIAWMGRLPHRYTERTGRVFDGLPVALLLVAITLATAAALLTTTL